ncbi:MAG: signal recognition particle-docking protein FtsY [Candidatus Wallbacteria bacterium]|nr:signal recognition particle-docking protein FtsY [Candidatus Wallbacteria bacterium]
MALLWWRKKDEGKPAAEKAPAGEAQPGTPASSRAQAQVHTPGTAGRLAPPAPPGERTSWLARLTSGLSRTRGRFTDQIRSLFGEARAFDPSVLDDLEAILLQADVGPRATTDLVELLRQRVAADPTFTSEAAMAALKDALRERLSRRIGPMNLDAVPSIVLIVGVNGVGKTTTIAKMARLFQAYGKRILLVAGDTFRAGAIEQLTVWSQRLGCEIVKGEAGADPSAIVFDGINAAKARGCDLVLMDTAGRLHTQSNLMDELGKINRVIKKAYPEAPHETFLILDATTGQNAINQAKVFDEMVPITGLVLTKIDGTAKGGVLVALADYLEVPIRFLGVGEGIDDLDNFRADEFVEALFR